MSAIRGRFPRFAAIACFDALAAVSALYAALLLRFNGAIPLDYAASARRALPVLVGTTLLFGFVARLHLWSFRLAGLVEAVRLGAALALASAAFVAIHAWTATPPLPKTVYALQFFLATTAVGAFRFGPRIAKTWLLDRRRREGAVRTLIVGAGSAADLLARDLARSTQHKYAVVGHVDDDPHKLGTSMHGKPVLGTIAQLPALIRRHEVSLVLLAIARLPAARIREILDLCASSKASFKIIPASFPLSDGRLTAAMLHDLSPEDLLPRDAVAFDEAEIRGLIAGRRALVTGAGGSIGGEICRQLARYGVSELVMLDMNENELYLGLRRLQRDHPRVKLHAEVADIREPERLNRLGARHRPELVFHAAAHKHVPLMETAPEEAVKNNVFGTLNVARMADACGAERLVVISTDKAVRPTSVMGATKRVAEIAVRDLARRSSTRMTAVRFGNVLGSAGSVVPIFKEQIARGGPITVTHPEVTRYFMTIPEAVGLVLLAGMGDYGELCVLDMGEPIRIVDMAKNLITMAGLVPGADVHIAYTGLRPGEKLYEELLTEEEEQTHQVRNRIMVARSPEPPLDVQRRLDELRVLAELGDQMGVLRALQSFVPTYCRPLAASRAASAQAAEQAPELAVVVPMRKAQGEMR